MDKLTAQCHQVTVAAAQLTAAGEKPTARAVAQITGLSYPTCWGTMKKSEELATTGRVRRVSGSGRPVTAAFRTPAKRRRSLSIVKGLAAGEHLDDAALQLSCSRSTLKWHLKSVGVWRRAGTIDACSNTPEVRQMRLDFATGCLAA